MASLYGRSPKNSYKEILTVDNADGIGANLHPIGDGAGNFSPLAISGTKVSLNNMVWPTAGGTANMVLRVSSVTNQLEWVQLTPASFTDLWNKAGDTMTGPLTLAGVPTAALHAATKGYVDSAVLPLTTKTYVDGLVAPLAAKSYVDSVVQGLDPKASVRVATTNNISLNDPQTIDGVAVVAGDRVLVKNQGNSAQNGIYVVAVGAWSRASDADTSAKVTTGMYAFVEDGTTNAATGWNLITKNVTLGTSGLVFSQFASASNYTAGTGINITGTTISTSLVGSNGVSVSGNTISGAYTAGTGVSITGSTISGNYTAGTGIAITGNVISATGAGAGGTGTSTPGGSNTYVQYNNNGAMGGSAGLTFNSTTNTLTVGSVTASTATATPSKIVLDGTFANTSAPANTQLKLQIFKSGNSTTDNWGFSINNNGQMGYHVGDSVTAGTWSHVFNVSDVERLRINTTGLQLADASNVITAPGRVVKIHNNATGAVTNPSLLQLDGSYSLGAPTNQKLKLMVYNGAATEKFGIGVFPAAMTYHVGDSATPTAATQHTFLVSDVEKFRVDQNGATAKTNLSALVGLNVGNSAENYNNTNGALLNVRSSTAFPMVKISSTSDNSGILGFGNSTSSYADTAVWRGAKNSITTVGDWMNVAGYSGVNIVAGQTAIGSQSTTQLVLSGTSSTAQLVSSSLVIGNAAATANTLGMTRFVVKATSDGNTNNSAAMAIQSTDGVGHLTFYINNAANDTSAHIATDSGHDILFGHGNLVLGTYTERARIDRNNRFMLGINNSPAQFAVQGNATTRASSNKVAVISDGAYASAWIGKSPAGNWPMLGGEQNTLSLGLDSAELVRLASNGDMIFGNGEGTSAIYSYYFRAPNAVGTNIQGGTLKLAGGTGTGTGGGGPIVMYTAGSTTTGTAGVGLSERFRIDPTGPIGINNSVPTASNAALAVIGHNTSIAAGTIKVMSTAGNAGAIVFGDSTAGSEYLGVFRGAINSRTTGGDNLTISGYNNISFTNGQAALGSQTEWMRLNNVGELILGSGEGTATSYNFMLRGAYTAGTNVAGANLTFAAGRSTGTSAGGSLIFQTAPAGATSGTAANGNVTRLTIDSNGLVSIGGQSAATTNTALMVFNAAQATAAIKVSATNNTGAITFGDWNSTTENVGIFRGGVNSRTTAGNSLTIGGYDSVSITAGAAQIGSQTEQARFNNAGEMIVGGGEGTANTNAFHIRGAYAVGTDIAGKNLTLSAGRGTGTAGGGALVFQTAGATTSGTGIVNLAERARIDNTGNLLLGTTTTVPSAKLVVASTTQGFLPPVMTTTQKNAIANPATGLVVFDSTLNKLCVCVAGVWQTIQSA